MSNTIDYIQPIHKREIRILPQGQSDLLLNLLNNQGVSIHNYGGANQIKPIDVVIDGFYNSSDKTVVYKRRDGNITTCPGAAYYQIDGSFQYRKKRIIDYNPTNDRLPVKNDDTLKTTITHNDIKECIGDINHIVCLEITDTFTINIDTLNGGSYYLEDIDVTLLVDDKSDNAQVRANDLYLPQVKMDIEKIESPKPPIGTQISEGYILSNNPIRGHYYINTGETGQMIQAIPVYFNQFGQPNGLYITFYGAIEKGTGLCRTKELFFPFEEPSIQAQKDAPDQSYLLVDSENRHQFRLYHDDSTAFMYNTHEQYRNCVIGIYKKKAEQVQRNNAMVKRAEERLNDIAIRTREEQRRIIEQYKAEIIQLEIQRDEVLRDLGKLNEGVMKYAEKLENEYELNYTRELARQRVKEDDSDGRVVSNIVAGGLGAITAMVIKKYT